MSYQHFTYQVGSSNARSGSRTTVYQYEAGVLFRHGRFIKRLGAGRHWTLFGTSIVKVDLRERHIVAASQEILTGDHVALRLSLVLRGRVVDPERWILKAQNAENQLYVSAQLALRQAVVARSFEDVLADQGAIGQEVVQSLNGSAAEIGFECSEARIRDITLPGTLKRAYTSAQTARQEGLAALERARGESAALRNLANAARMLQGNPELLALRTLQAFEQGSGNVVLLNRLLQPLQQPVATTRAEPEKDE